MNDDQNDNIRIYAPLQREDWINRKWRPMMAVTYMAICIFDFIVGPIINYWFFRDHGATFMSWKPLTMSDGGLFHIAMGAIIGITAWQRGQEKIRGASTSYQYSPPGAQYGYRPGYMMDRSESDESDNRVSSTAPSRVSGGSGRVSGGRVSGSGRVSGGAGRVSPAVPNADGGSPEI